MFINSVCSIHEAWKPLIFVAWFVDKINDFFLVFFSSDLIVVTTNAPNRTLNRNKLKLHFHRYRLVYNIYFAITHYCLLFQRKNRKQHNTTRASYLIFMHIDSLSFLTHTFFEKTLSLNKNTVYDEQTVDSVDCHHQMIQNLVTATKSYTWWLTTIISCKTAQKCTIESSSTLIYS